MSKESLANTWRSKFSAGEYEERYARVRRAMESSSLDCLIVYGSSLFFGSDPGSPNLVYLSGYAPCVHGYLVFPRRAEPTLVIFAGNHLANAHTLSVIADIRTARDVDAAVVARVQELGVARPNIGIVGNLGWTGTSVPVEHYQTFANAFAEGTVQVVTDWYESVRLTKTSEEVEVLGQAAGICDAAQEYLRPLALPAAVDVALQNQIWTFVHDKGGRTAFGHVQSTPMASPAMHYPSYYPVGRALEQGDVVMTELTAGLSGYFGKLFATLFLGHPTAAYAQMFRLAADIRKSLYERVTPGMKVRDVRPILAGDAERFGYESNSMLSGWSTYNTPPAYNPKDNDSELDMALNPGLCFSVVGWVRNPERSCAAWVGDTAIMTLDGLKSLHRYPIDDMEHATL